MSDNGYDGAGGTKTASFSIQVAVAGVNDAPVVVAPPVAWAVPGEPEALPGFMVLDPDTDTDGRISEGMLEVGGSNILIFKYATRYSQNQSQF